MIGSTVSYGGIGRRLLNVRETAQYLGLEVDTVYKKARLRELPCVKVGRALRFDLKALERFVEQHTVTFRQRCVVEVEAGRRRVISGSYLPA
jgi:excisionase family DNA binding protein